MVMGRTDGGFNYRVITAIGPIPIQIEKADFNQDGSLDLAILSVGTVASQAQEYGRTLHVLQGTGTGGFLSPFTIALRTVEPAPSSTEPGPRFAVGDLDGDRWPDLALLEPSRSLIRIAWNEKTGTPSFREEETPLGVGPGSSEIASGDLDGDVRDDLVVGSSVPQGGGRIQVLLSGAAGWVAGGTADLAGSPTCLALERIDGDGALDVAVGGKLGSGGEACSIRTDGQGGLGAVKSRPLAGIPSEVAVGDLDGDGLKDLVLSQPDKDLLSSVLVFDPAGSFLRGDANGDRRLDIADCIDILFHLFRSEGTDCLEALDGDGDGEVNIADPIFILGYLYLEGLPPDPPFPEPGKHHGPGGLGCERP